MAGYTQTLREPAPPPALTPDQIERRRKVAEAMMARGTDYSPIQSWTQGAARVAESIAGTLEDKKLDAAAKAGQDAASAGFASMFGGGGAAPGMGATGGAATGAAPMPPDQIKALIDQNVPEADRDFAYRMAGKESNFNPNAVSPTGAAGLYQFTRGTGKDFGLVGQNGDMRSDPVLNTQAFVKLTEANRNTLRQSLGREPTYGELALAHQQGAQGALQLLSGGSVDPKNLAVQAGNPKNAADIMKYYGYGEGQPTQVASASTGTMTDAAPMGAAQPAGPQVAQAAPMTAPAGVAGVSGALSERAQRAMAVLNNDFATPAQKAVAQALLSREMKEDDPNAALDRQLKQAQLAKTTAEIEAMPMDRKAKDLAIQKAEADLKAAPVDLEGKVIGNDKARAELGQVGVTTDQNNYNFYAKQEMDAGRQPMPFQDWSLSNKKAGASTVQIDQKAEGAFETESAKAQAKNFNDMATDGNNAKADIARIQQLRELLKTNPGGLKSGLMSWASDYGLKVGDDASNLEAAKAILEGLVPQQRGPNSGPMSDGDARMYRASLPSLMNTPQGNAILVDTMEALARYRDAQGSIATQVLTGEISRKEGAQALRDMPDPLAAFKEWKKANGGAAPASTPGAPDAAALKKKWGLE